MHDAASFLSGHFGVPMPKKMPAVEPNTIDELTNYGKRNIGVRPGGSVIGWYDETDPSKPNIHLLDVWDRTNPQDRAVLVREMARHMNPRSGLTQQEQDEDASRATDAYLAKHGKGTMREAGVARTTLRADGGTVPEARPDASGFLAEMSRRYNDDTPRVAAPPRDAGEGSDAREQAGLDAWADFMQRLRADRDQPMAMAGGGLVPETGGLAAGGSTSPGANFPYFVREAAREVFHPGGLIKSPVAGRTDRLPMSVASDSYVLPADVVSGLGEGNTLAGATILDKTFKSGPYGTKLSGRSGRGRGIRALATGGAAAARAEPVKIIAAGGEYVISPDVVMLLGNGNAKHGHEVLDAFVKRVRNTTRKTLGKLPGPKKD